MEDLNSIIRLATNERDNGAYTVDQTEDLNDILEMLYTLSDMANDEHDADMLACQVAQQSARLDAIMNV